MTMTLTTGPGDGQPITCPSCGDELVLSNLLAHVEQHAAPLATNTPGGPR